MLYLHYDTLCDLTKALPHSKNMTEGQQIVKSDMIAECGATLKTDDRVDLFSLILQISGLKSDLHAITGMLTTTFFLNKRQDGCNIEISRMGCSSAGCNIHCCEHSVAVLLFKFFIIIYPFIL